MSTCNLAQTASAISTRKELEERFKRVLEEYFTDIDEPIPLSYITAWVYLYMKMFEEKYLLWIPDEIVSKLYSASIRTEDTTLKGEPAKSATISNISYRTCLSIISSGRTISWMTYPIHTYKKFLLSMGCFTTKNGSLSTLSGNIRDRINRSFFIFSCAAVLVREEYEGEYK